MNILLFCSNPVNGGTAKIFFELTMFFKKHKKENDKIFAAVDVDNPVEIYKKISFIDRLKVYSEEEICKGLFGGNFISRIIKKIIRQIKYFGIRKENILVMKTYLIRNNIDCILIHNGGYVGDDLCNQMLEAAFECEGQVKIRIYVLHNDFKKNLFSKLRYRTYDRFLCKTASHLITVSNYTKKRILDSSFIDKDIQVLYNGLPESHTISDAEKIKKIDIDCKQKNVLMLGNFQENKGQLQFIEVAKVIQSKCSNATFVFIGNIYDKNYYDQCIIKIHEYGLKQFVKIKHDINNAAEYIDMFDVVALPSMYDESFGLISVEAMSKGVPVVAFACGGVPEVVIDGKDGYVVPIGDTFSMAEKILKILNDSNLSHMLGKNGREDYINRFCVDAMGKKYYELINQYR